MAQNTCILSISNFFKKKPVPSSRSAFLSNLLHLRISSPVKINSLYPWKLLSPMVLNTTEWPDKNWTRRWNCFRHTFFFSLSEILLGLIHSKLFTKGTLFTFFPEASRLNLLSLLYILCKIWRPLSWNKVYIAFKIPFKSHSVTVTFFFKVPWTIFGALRYLVPFV